MVQECYTYVDKTPDKETKIKLIETLRTITEGKIYVEVERARLTHILAKIREEENNVAEAAKIIQELQVETYGSMDKREKVELILEQMRLCLAIKDYVRTQIISKKINTKFFEEENTLVYCYNFFIISCWFHLLCINPDYTINYAFITTFFTVLETLQRCDIESAKANYRL